LPTLKVEIEMKSFSNIVKINKSTHFVPLEISKIRRFRANEILQHLMPVLYFSRKSKE